MKNYTIVIIYDNHNSNNVYSDTVLVLYKSGLGKL